MSRLARFLPLILLALIALASAALLLRGGERAAHFEARLGRSVPAFELAALGADGAVTPEAFAGKPYVINLFASWCAPCRVEHPMLMRLAAEGGAPILGVAYKDQPGAAQRMLTELGDPFAVKALDPEGRFGLDLGIAGVPETFVIGADGRIAAVHRGPLDEAALRDVILPALR